MCPVCWAALVAQVVFFATLGLVLVVVTDLKVGLPMAVVTLALAASNWFWGVGVPVWVLYVTGGLLLARALWVLVKDKGNWVRRLAIQIGKWSKRKLRPIFYGSNG